MQNDPKDLHPNPRPLAHLDHPCQPMLLTEPLSPGLLTAKEGCAPSDVILQFSDLSKSNHPALMTMQVWIAAVVPHQEPIPEYQRLGLAAEFVVSEELTTYNLAQQLSPVEQMVVADADW